MLRGTGLDETSRRRKRRLVENFRIAEAEWPEIVSASSLSSSDRSAAAFPTAEEYLCASTLSSSRAFRVDEEHGEGLLPLVDMLNHKAALVPCHGADGESDGDSDDDNNNGDAEADEQERASSSATLLRDVTLRIPPAACDVDDDAAAADDEDAEEDAAYVITVRGVNAGEEVCHTYGELGNWDLMAGYGFTMADNAFDTALLPWRCVEAAAASHYGARVLRCRLRELRESGHWGSRSDSLGHGVIDTPFVFDRRGACPPELRVLLHLLLDSSPMAKARREARALEGRMDAASRKVVVAAIQLHMCEYAKPDEGLGRAAPKRQRLVGGTGASVKALHASRLVESELSIWAAACNGGSRPELDGAEARAAEAGAAARKQRLNLECDAHGDT